MTTAESAATLPEDRIAAAESPDNLLAVIAVGASAGGIDALQAFAHSLPAGLRAAVLIVMHMPPDHRTRLPRILADAGVLPATLASNGESIRGGHIYLAPPNRHLLVMDGTLRLATGPVENHNRPAIDPLFRSAARTWGPKAIGVVLSGSLDDGTAGLAAIKAAGGRAVVQAPDDAAFPGMPDSAIASVEVDHILPAREMGPLLARLTEEAGVMTREDMQTAEAAAMDPEPSSEMETEGLVYSCPECDGVLVEIEDGGTPLFRCRVGHRFGLQTLGSNQETNIERALWTAVRAVEENMDVCRKLAARARRAGRVLTVRRYQQRVDTMHEAAHTLRAILQETATGQGEEAASGES
jgi:two-component system, chemotaxis family, protein-glutamate methylesterase/glutaminase